FDAAMSAARPKYVDCPSKQRRRPSQRPSPEGRPHKGDAAYLSVRDTERFHPLSDSGENPPPTTRCSATSTDVPDLCGPLSDGRCNGACPHPTASHCPH